MELKIDSMNTVGELAIRAQRTIIVDNAIQLTEDIPAGIAGTAGAAGVMTLAEGHGITDADIVSVVWSAGERIDCTVSAYDSTSITVASGSGDTLPASGAVVISVKTELQAVVDGDSLKGFAVGANIAVIPVIADGSANIISKSLAANSGYSWDEDNGEVNPLAGEAPTKINVYNKSVTAGVFKAFYVYDNE